MAHQHFTRDDRVLLDKLKQSGLAVLSIARILGFHPSSVYRELLQRGRRLATVSGLPEPVPDSCAPPLTNSTANCSRYRPGKLLPSSSVLLIGSSRPGRRLVSRHGLPLALGVAQGLHCQYPAEGGRFNDYNAQHASLISNDELLSLDVDILVLAALGDAITEQNMRSVKAKYIVEVANGPINRQAHEYLTTREVIILPDIIANAGGVVVSYLEWLQNLKHERWSEAKVNQKLRAYMKQAMSELLKRADGQKYSLSHAAYMNAIEGLTK